eukprot:COSAG04_NODE_209_length_20232_cov_116.817315_3_plen_275_part_00
MFDGAARKQGIAHGSKNSQGSFCFLNFPSAEEEDALSDLALSCVTTAPHDCTLLSLRRRCANREWISCSKPIEGGTSKRKRKEHKKEKGGEAAKASPQRKHKKRSTNKLSQQGSDVEEEKQEEQPTLHHESCPTESWRVGDRFRLIDDDAEWRRLCASCNIEVSRWTGSTSGWSGVIQQIEPHKARAQVQYDRKFSERLHGCTEQWIPLEAARRPRTEEQIVRVGAVASQPKPPRWTADEDRRLRKSGLGPDPPARLLTSPDRAFVAEWTLLCS